MRATFSEAVTGVDVNDFSLAGTATGTIGTVTQISPLVYDIAITNVSGDGTLGLNLNGDNTGIIDNATNPIANAVVTGATVTLDHTAPTITGVTVPANTTYITGQTLDFSIATSEIINVSGTPRLPITLGNQTVNANYLSGTGTNTLSFSYTVAAGDVDVNGITVGTTLDTNGGTIRDAANNDLELTLINVDTTTGILIEAVAPTVTIASRDTPAGNATSLTMRALFSEAVTGISADDFSLAATGTATGIIGTLTPVDAKTYDIAITDITGDGTVGLNLNGSNTGIIDTPGNAIASTVVTGTTVTLDHTAPTVDRVAVPANRTYITGQALDFSVTTSESVTINGVPRIPLTVGTRAVNADYLSGSGTTTLTFSYTVTAGDVDADGVAVGTTLDANSGTIRDAAGNDLTLNLNNISTTSGVLVDTLTLTASIAPVVTPAGNTNSVTYRATFSTDVRGVNAEDFSLAKTGTANGSIGTITHINDQTYDITITNISGNGTLGLNLNGSNTGITNLVGTAIANTVIVGASITLDHTTPIISRVTVPENGTYSTGRTLDFSVAFSEAVTVTGTPRIPITLGTHAIHADYLSGTGTSTLTFRYTVVANDMDANGIVLGTALDTNGGTLRDAAGNDATRTLNQVGTTAGVLVEAIAPTVTIAPSSTPAGNATNLTMRATFSEAVTGVNASDFSLTTTGTATATIGTVTPFSDLIYDIAITHVSGDGALGLNLNGSNTNITDTPGNAIANVIVTGTTVTLDHTAPTVTSVNVPANRTYIAGQTLDFSIATSEVVTVSGVPRIPLTVGTRTVNADYLSGSGTTALTFRYTVAAGDVDANGITLDNALNINGGTVRDATGNNLTLTLNHIDTTLGILVEAIVPTVSIAPIGSIAGNATDILYRASFSEAVTDVDVNDFSLAHTGSANGTIGTLTRVNSQTYDIPITSVSGEGILGLNLNGSATGITDNAGNAIANTVVTGTTVTLDHTIPTISGVSIPTDATYTRGQPLDFTIAVSEIVTINGIPRLPLTIGTHQVHADYVSGSGTQTLVFRYTVASGDLDTDGIAIGTELNTNNGTIRDAAGNDLTLTLNQIRTTHNILVDAGALHVSLTSSGTPAGNASDLIYEAVFSEEVTGVDIGDFSLTKTGSTNGTIDTVTRINGHTYDIAITHITGDGTLGVNLSGSNTGIANLANDTFVRSTVAGTPVTLDHSAPIITQITLPTNGLYSAGNLLDFTVTFNESITLNTTQGTPRIPITLDAQTLYANYSSGNQTAALHFQYRVTQENTTPHSITLAPALDANGSTLTDASTNPASLTFHNLGNTDHIIVGRPSYGTQIELPKTTRPESRVPLTAHFVSDSDKNLSTDPTQKLSDVTSTIIQTNWAPVALKSSAPSSDHTNDIRSRTNDSYGGNAKLFKDPTPSIRDLINVREQQRLNAPDQTDQSSLQSKSEPEKTPPIGKRSLNQQFEQLTRYPSKPFKETRATLKRTVSPQKSPSLTR